MQKLDYELLKSTLQSFQKAAFVPMPGGQAEPVAGAGMATEAMGAPMGDPAMGGMPMDPAMAGGDPMAGGMPMDPSMGGMPMDPAMGGMPMDPAMMGGAPMEPPVGQITMSVPEFIQLIQVLNGGKAEAGAGAEPGTPKRKGGTAEISEKLDLLLSAIGAPQPAMQ